jgi:trk system potassium uptake protein TrkA
MAGKKFAVLGLGQFARTLALKLYEAGAEVIAGDINGDIIEQIKESVTVAAKMDATDARALTEQGIDKVDVAIVGMGSNFEANILTTFALKQIGVKKVISKATNWTQKRILEQIGADEVISPEDESAIRLTNRLIRPELTESLELAKDHRIAKIGAPARFVGKSLSQVDARNTYKVNIVAIKKTAGKGKKSKEIINDIPSGSDILEAGDLLYVIGADADIADFVGPTL